MKAMGPVMWSLMMPLFQGPHTEEGLAATAAAGEAEVTTSTARETDVTISTAGEAEVIVSPAGEAEASSVPAEVSALSMTTEDPGEGVTPVSISECMFHFTSFWEMVGVSGGNRPWPFSSVYKMQSDSLVGLSLNRH